MGDPQSAFGIEVQVNRLDDLRLGGDQFDLEPWRQVEQLLLLMRGSSRCAGESLGAEIRTRVCVLLGVDGRHLDDQSKDYAPKRPNAILDQTLFHSYCSIFNNNLRRFIKGLVCVFYHSAAQTTKSRFCITKDESGCVEDGGSMGVYSMVGNVCFVLSAVLLGCVFVPATKVAPASINVLAASILFVLGWLLRRLARSSDSER